MSSNSAYRRPPDFLVPAISFKGSDNAENVSEDQSATLAPLIFEAWYVIALGKNVDRTLGSIKVLGQPLVYFRSEDGSPVVLDDRCSHRRFPLSKGKLERDTVQCGYHGYTYERSGRCIWAPGLPPGGNNGAKLPFGVRSYPCTERGPWLWVWMGRPEAANPEDIPMPEMQVNPPGTLHGYKLNPSNYMMVIENLLDLSHLHFLHGACDLDHVAVVPDEMPGPENGVAWRKRVERTEVGLVGLNCGEDPQRLCRFQEDTTQYGPSVTFGTQIREALPGDTLPPPRPGLLQVCHALTPVDRRNTHQFFTLVLSDPFSIGHDKALQMVEDVVFEQDVDAVRAMQQYVEEDFRPGRVEFSMAYDRFGMKMRKILAEMKRRELALG